MELRQRLGPAAAPFTGPEWLKYIWEFRYFGVLMIRILLFGVLYYGPLFSETPIVLMVQATLL